MEFFLGKFDYMTDDAGRLNFPAKFRKVMQHLDETSLIVSKAQPDYLIIYPYKLWKERVGDKIAKLSHSNANAARLRMEIGLQMAEASLDKQGRLNIPPEYYRHVNIDKNVRIVGCTDVIQLWDPTTHDRISEIRPEKSLLEELSKFEI